MSMLLSTAKVKTDARATGVEIDSDSLHVSLADGRIVSATLEWGRDQRGRSLILDI